MRKNRFVSLVFLVGVIFFVTGLNVQAQVLKPTRGVEKVFTCEAENKMDNPRLEVAVYSDTLSGVSKVEFKNYVNSILDYRELYAARQQNLSKEGQLVYLGKWVSFKVSSPSKISTSNYYFPKNTDVLKVHATLEIQSPGFKVHNYDLVCKYL